MTLESAIKGMLAAENSLRSKEGVGNPIFISLHMQRLSQYTGGVEEHLAEYERQYEVDYAGRLHLYMITKELKVTEAERRVVMDMGELKGQIKYLSRLVGSAWRQIGVAQSRWNHLSKEAGTQI